MNVLKGLAVVDPACGSGSFLVGMLHILDDLQDRANRVLGYDQLSFDRKKAIIGKNLYGVDVMEWACHVAELRLWLSLAIDADIPRAELQLRIEPLLPHFSFNIRCGNSLLQEIGGMNLVQIRADFSGIPRSLKTRTSRLKNEKLKFFNNDKTCRYRSKQELEQEELNLFRDLVDTHAEDVKKQIDDLKELINDLKAQQMTIEGTIDETTSQKLKRQEIEWSKQIEVLTIDYDRLVEARGALANAPTSPFVWDIAFVEIFSDDKRGFDIVIGNPPYVRQESIADPKLPREAAITRQQESLQSKTCPFRVSSLPAFLRVQTREGYQTGKSVRRRLPQTRRQKRPLHLFLLPRTFPPQSQRLVLFHHLQFVAGCRLRKRPSRVPPQALPHQADYGQPVAALLRLRRCEHRHLPLLRTRRKTPVGIR